MKINTLFNHAFKIYLTWIILLVLFSFLIPTLSEGKSGGSDLDLLAHIVDIGLNGFFVLSILTSITFWQWFKKYWFLNLLIMCSTGYLILSEYLIHRKYKEGSITEQIETVGNDQWIIKREYYYDSEKIKNEEFWKNGKKDSVWREFSKNGEVIKRVRYKSNLKL